MPSHTHPPASKVTSPVQSSPACQKPKEKKSHPSNSQSVSHPPFSLSITIQFNSIQSLTASFSSLVLNMPCDAHPIINSRRLSQQVILLFSTCCCCCCCCYSFPLPLSPPFLSPPFLLLPPYKKLAVLPLFFVFFFFSFLFSRLLPSSSPSFPLPLYFFYFFPSSSSSSLSYSHSHSHYHPPIPIGPLPSFLRSFYPTQITSFASPSFPFPSTVITSISLTFYISYPT